MENNSDNGCVMEDNRFQNVYIELKDGTVGMFSGPVLFEGDPNGLVKNISFSLPQDIPNNQTWSDLCNQNVVV
jgi:hypothetical protein